jgi:predicted nucleotidyltransferase
VIVPENNNSPTDLGAEPTFGLTDHALGLLRGFFSADPQIEKAIVYGSRAIGNFRNGSDIDITLDAPGMDFDDFVRLCSGVDDLMLPWNIDLSLLSHIDNPDLLSHIARVGKPLWIRKQSHAC